MVADNYFRAKRCQTRLDSLNEKIVYIAFIVGLNNLKLNELAKILSLIDSYCAKKENIFFSI